jgi:glutamate formiminotransferase
MIVVKNIDPKSYHRTLDLQFKSSAGSATVAINAGIVPVACRVKELIIGTTASAIAYGISVKANNVDISANFTIAALAASGGTQKSVAAVSGKLITAGTLISIGLSSTAAIAEVLGILRFEIDRAEK